MTFDIAPMRDSEADRLAASSDEPGLGALRTSAGNLPLERIDIRADVTGLTSRVELTQDFVNTFDVPLEASYIFPLPDRGAVTAMRMTADGRVVAAELQEREAARRAYDKAIAAGHRAAIAEEERPGVFTMRVGNLLPGEGATVRLTLRRPAALRATARRPSASRWWWRRATSPASPLPGPPVGDGTAATPTPCPTPRGSRPPVLLPGFPQPGAPVASTSTSTPPACRCRTSGPACTPSQLERSPTSGRIDSATGRAARPRFHPAFPARPTATSPHALVLHARPRTACPGGHLRADRGAAGVRRAAAAARCGLRAGPLRQHGGLEDGGGPPGRWRAWWTP